MALMQKKHLLVLALMGVALSAVLIGSAFAEIPSATGWEAGVGLEWMKAAGFPVWALVLLYLGHRMLGQIQLIMSQLHDHVEKTERRLAHLEANCAVLKEHQEQISK
jgi:hypothetical protein